MFLVSIGYYSFVTVRENSGRTLVTAKVASSGCIQKKHCISWMRSVLHQHQLLTC